MKRTLYVAVDGYDGSGKTSLICELRDKIITKSKKSSIERLLPLTVDLFKTYSNGTNDYMDTIADKFRLTAYLWESYVRLKMKYEEWQQNDVIFFDRWIFTNLVNDIDFGEDKEIVEFLIKSMPKPDILFLIQTSPSGILDHLKKKDDWMLSFYDSNEIMSQVLPFYKGYIQNLQKYEVNYVVINGDLPFNQVVQTAYSKLNESL